MLTECSPSTMSFARVDGRAAVTDFGEVQVDTRIAWAIIRRGAHFDSKHGGPVSA